MSITVTPPPQIQLPNSLSKDADTRTYFRHLNRMLLQLWRRTGGSSDSISEADSNIVAIGARGARNAAKIHAMQKIDFDVEVITSSFTTYRNQIIICDNSTSINVTLDTQAIEGDRVHVKRNNAEVVVIGTIDGQTDMTINVQYYSALLVFNGTNWNRI